MYILKSMSVNCTISEGMSLFKNPALPFFLGFTSYFVYENFDANAHIVY